MLDITSFFIIYICTHALFFVNIVIVTEKLNILFHGYIIIIVVTVIVNNVVAIHIPHLINYTPIYLL